MWTGAHANKESQANNADMEIGLATAIEALLDEELLNARERRRTEWHSMQLRLPRQRLYEKLLFHT